LHVRCKISVESLNVTSVLKCTFIQIFIHFLDSYHHPIENLRKIERVGEVAIIKQQIVSMYISETLAYLKNAKIAGRKLYAARC
jgi:hypothetical protein